MDKARHPRRDRRSFAGVLAARWWWFLVPLALLAGAVLLLLALEGGTGILPSIYVAF